MTNFLPPFERSGPLNPAILTSQVVASASLIFETLEPLGRATNRSRNIATVLNVNGDGEITAIRLAMAGRPFARKLDAKRLFINAPDGSKLTIKHLDVTGLEFPPGEKTSLWVASTNFDWAINRTNHKDDGALSQQEMQDLGIGDWSIRVHVEVRRDPTQATLKWVAIPKPVAELGALPGNAAKPGYPSVAISDGDALMAGVPAEPFQLVGTPFYPCLINDAAPASAINLPDDEAILDAMVRFWSSGNIIRNLTLADWVAATKGPGEPNSDNGVPAWAWSPPDTRNEDNELSSSDPSEGAYPDYFTHWTGTKCYYNAEFVDGRGRTRGGGNECWWLSWYWFWLWLAIGLTTGLGVLGCCCGPLCGSNSVKCCLGGTGIGAGFCCPLISWPFMYYIYIDRPRCELCREKYRSSVFKFLNNSDQHKKLCLEKHVTVYDDIPDSPLYTCKTCENPLKVWPVDKLADSVCIQCNNKIINDGSNLHVCFTCAGKGEMTFHHICNRHAAEGTMLEITFLPRNKSKLGIYKTSLELRPLGPPAYPQSTSHEFDKSSSQYPYKEASAPSEPSNDLPPAEPRSHQTPAPPSNVLPPGWQVVTNPVTGVPYALCDPSGEIQPLIINNTNVPPPYAEAVAYSPN